MKTKRFATGAALLACSLLLTIVSCHSEGGRDAQPQACAPAVEEKAQPESNPSDQGQRPSPGEPAATGKPLRVGFDVDDTLLFSTPAFDEGFASKQHKPYSDGFWTVVNGSDEGRSQVKARTREILEKHKAEGAEIFAITARNGAGGESLKKYLFKAFGIPPENVFFETKGKVQRIRDLGISIYYGDSDSDITAAIDAGARGVRILRSPKSSYKKKYNPGKFGEEIIPNSED